MKRFKHEEAGIERQIMSICISAQSISWTDAWQISHTQRNKLVSMILEVNGVSHF